jgi:hypothetical protein
MEQHSVKFEHWHLPSRRHTAPEKQAVRRKPRSCSKLHHVLQWKSSRIQQAKEMTMKLSVLALATPLLMSATLAHADTCPAPSTITAKAQVQYEGNQWIGSGSEAHMPETFFRAAIKVDSADPSFGNVTMCAYKFANGKTLTMKPQSATFRVAIASLNENWSGSKTLKSCGMDQSGAPKSVEDCSFEVIQQADSKTSQQTSPQSKPID